MPNNWTMPPVYLQSGNPEGENNATLAYPGQLGMRFTVKNPPRTIPTTSVSGQSPEAGRSKTYQIVKTDSSMTVAPFPGAVAWWADKTQYMVTTSVTKLGRGRIAGVFRNAVTPGFYTCVQTGGPALTKYVDAPTAAPSAAGLLVIPSATDGKADCLAAASAASYPALGTSASAINPAYTGGPNDNVGIVDLDVPQTT